MGSLYPKPEEVEKPVQQITPIERGSPDEIDVYPEHDNIRFDTLYRKEKQPINFVSTLVFLEKTPRFEVNESVYRACEEQRHNEQYFRIENIVEGNSSDELFIKVIDFSEEARKDTNRNYETYKKNKRIIKELLLNQKHKHRASPQIIGYFVDERQQRFYLMYENYETQVSDLFKNNKFGSFINKIRLLKNFIEIIISLHSTGIVSYDIHPSSIGLTYKQNAIKLLTFCNSVKVNEKLDIFHESWFDRATFDMFTSPEIYLNKEIIIKYSWAADIWSLGVLCSCIFQEGDEGAALKVFKRNFEADEVNIYADNGIFHYGKMYELLCLDKVENAYVRAFICSMISPDPTLRPNIFQIADNYNKLIGQLKLDSEYQLVYLEENVYSFLKVFDYSVYEIIKDLQKAV